MKKIWLIIPLAVCLFASCFISCNKDEIKDLERRIEELEKQLAVKDSVLIGNLEINSQAMMNLMTGREIKNILGTLSIRNCVNLRPLEGLESVTTLDLEISSDLHSLEGLNELTRVDYLDLYFQTNAPIDLSALDGLDSVRNISLNGILPEISWFGNITTLESIWISTDLPDFTLTGFDKLETIEYYLSIQNYKGNLEVPGFDNLKSLSDLYLNSNTLNVSGFEQINTLNYLGISGKSLIFHGLNGITSIEYVSLVGTYINISGFGSLESLGSLDVYVENSITGLSNLKTINDYLYLNPGVVCNI